jgi:hypothetical protein
MPFMKASMMSCVGFFLGPDPPRRGLLVEARVRVLEAAAHGQLDEAQLREQAHDFSGCAAR